MRKDLLLRLADLLEADAANPKGVKFDLTDWSHPVEAEETSGIHAWPLDTEVIPVNCGTAACAMGLAAISGAFKNEGLTFELEKLHGGDNMAVMWPIFRGHTGFDAASALFDLDRVTVSALFDPDHYGDNTKGAEAELEVARRLRGLVDGSWSAPDELDDEYSDYDDED